MSKRERLRGDDGEMSGPELSRGVAYRVRSSNGGGSWKNGVCWLMAGGGCRMGSQLGGEDVLVCSSIYSMTSRGYDVMVGNEWS